MSPYLKITGRTFTIWLLACFINGLLCGIALSIVNNSYTEMMAAIIGIAFISLFFAAPGFLIFWIILLLKILLGTKEAALFRSALIAGFIIASVTALLFPKMFSFEFDNYSSIPAASIILSAISSIMLHFKQFKKIK